MKERTCRVCDSKKICKHYENLVTILTDQEFSKEKEELILKESACACSYFS